MSSSEIYSLSSVLYSSYLYILVFVCGCMHVCYV